MAAIAITVFVVAYVLIATERVPKTVVALVGAGIVVALGVSTSEDVFYSAETGIDWDVIFLLLGMMIIVGILRRTGVFEFVAIWAAKRAKGSPLRVMILLVLITAARLGLPRQRDHRAADRAGHAAGLRPARRPPRPVPDREVIASNIGGTSTLIGDPPNIIIASRSGLSFNDFLLNLAPIAALAIAVFIATLPLLFRGSFNVDPARVADVMALNEREAIKDRRLLIICGIVLAAVFTGFIGHAVFHIEPSVVALLGAGTLVLLSRSKPREFMPSVEWETLLFFTGLFIMIGALVKTGVIDRLAGAAVEATGGDALTATMMILFVSALLSGIVDNIPYVAAMSPDRRRARRQHLGPHQSAALWWALAIGADFGGNPTAIGASANVVVLGIARRSGTPISFWEFTRKGAIITVITVALAAPYLWLRYFVFD